jgi:hypothetical protein
MYKRTMQGFLTSTVSSQFPVSTFLCQRNLISTLYTYYHHVFFDAYFGKIELGLLNLIDFLCIV